MLCCTPTNLTLFSSTGSNVIELGSYILDKEEMTLANNEGTVKLEPKVLALLTYLYKNGNRYVSMAELHENVWQDRCVSDAAVRRAIGKLRLLFNDDHKSPSYIQSIPKRGYKLICLISTTDSKEDIIATNPVVNSVVNKTVPQFVQEAVTVTNKSVNEKNSYTKDDIFTKLLKWGRKSFFLLFVLIIGIFFISPLVYRIADTVG